MTLACNPAMANTIKYDSFVLKNGMQVVVVPNHKVPAVSHMVWYRVGAQDEHDGKTGLAHLFEHLMFKATDKLESGEFSSSVAKSGGNDNAFTHYDYTGYYQNIARDKLAMVMEMEANRMQHLLVNEEQLEREKLVVLEERRSRIENNPIALLAEKMQNALFENHPYGRPIIGYPDDIAKLSVEDSKAFYKRYYAPNNAVLVVVGDISADTLKPLAERYYGVLEPANIPKRNIQKTIDLPKAKKIIHRDARIQQPQWLRFYVAPQYNENCNDCTALILLSFLLGESRTSLLYETLVVEKKLATSISSNYDDLSLGPATFSLSATPAKGVSIEQLEQEIETHLKTSRSTLFSKAQIERAKNALTAQVIYAQEDFTTLARIFGNLYVLGLDGNYVNNWHRNIENVTQEQIMHAAQKILNDEHAITGLLLPENFKGEAVHATP